MVVELWLPLSTIPLWLFEWTTWHLSLRIRPRRCYKEIVVCATFLKMPADAIRFLVVYHNPSDYPGKFVVRGTDRDPAEKIVETVR